MSRKSLGSSQPRDQTQASCIGRQILYCLSYQGSSPLSTLSHVSYPYYFSNLKNGENYILKSEASKRLIKKDYVAVDYNKICINHFANHFHQKHFNFSTILLSCWNKKFFPLYTIFIKWKDSLLKYIYSSIYILNEDLIFGYNTYPTCKRGTTVASTSKACCKD